MHESEILREFELIANWQFVQGGNGGRVNAISRIDFLILFA